MSGRLLTWVRGRGLKKTLFVSYPLVLVLLLVPAGLLLLNHLRAAFDEDLAARARATAQAAAARARAPLAAEAAEGARTMARLELGDLLDAEGDLAYATIVLPGGEPLAHRGRAAGDRPDGYRGAVSAERPLRIDEAADLVHVFQPVLGGEGPIGAVQIGFSRRPVHDRLAALARGSVAVGALGVLLFLAVGGLISTLMVGSAIERMQEVARGYAQGDLTRRVDVEGDQELSTMADALNRLGENLHETIGRVQGVSEGLGGVISRLSRTGDAVSRGAGQTYQSVEATSQSMEEITASLQGIAANVEVLAKSAEESSSSIAAMAATNDEVAENLASLSASVEETVSAIEQMAYSIREVAKRVEELSSAAEETSDSMNQMDVSITQVETNANETARLSEQVSQDAEIGVLALGKTLTGIDKIKDSSRTAAEVIEQLGRRIGQIGNVLNVIDDVAEQTNLLALNAAIIAAQAGEHGKGFAVVADEIKDLAERTGASTKEIAELIRGVQDESRNAISAVDRGMKSVEEGVRLGTEAEGALKKIADSSGKATQMVKAIARATVEQARGSRQVTGAIHRIVETVQQIAVATAGQARGSEQIMKSAEKMKIITRHVERSSQEQASGSKQITRAVASISEMVRQLANAQTEQTRGSERVMHAVEAIKNVALGQNGSVQDLEAAIAALESQASVLQNEVRRFRV